MDIPVDFLLENLKELVLYHYNLITSAKSELEKLTNDLSTLKAILKDASRKYKKNEVFKDWERQVRETVYDIEDTIDTCVTELAAEKGKNIVRRAVSKPNRISLAKQVSNLREDKIKTLFENHRIKIVPTLEQSDVIPDTTAADIRKIRQKKRQNTIVGMDDEALKLIGFLNEPSDKLEVVSIIGMPGLGKTTVAWKIFQDPIVAYEFPDRIWVNISDDLNIRNVLLTILGTFTDQVPADTTSNEDLGGIVKNHLNSRKFLLVMDDVWTPEAWDDLKSFLPMNNAVSRVLITSREEKVAFRANVNKKAHNHTLRFLNEEESWDLLQYEVYDAVKVVSEDLVQVGKLISQNCDGLPLSLVVIGGILKDKISDARGVVAAIKTEWEDVYSSIETYLVYGDKMNRLENIIRLSYAKLPYELRDCFLYLGVFPEDASIPAKKLTLLWISEGFIQEIPKRSLEEVAADNLKDLINRNLLMVEKAKLNGEAKICRVHDTIRQFCRTEAEFNKLNLFKEISFTNGVFEPSIDKLGNCRRLCVHSYAHKFFIGKPKVHKARSFLCFPKSPINLEATHIAPFTDAFHLLRVLDAENMKFPKFPLKLAQLIHLRYLTLTFANDQTKLLPAVLSNLWNLQTLLVDTPSHSLVIKANIWIMMNLRHLKTKASIVLYNEGRGDSKDEGKGGENLQTLARLSPESCNDAVFSKAKNISKLGIQGDLNSILNSNSLEKLNLLKTLKLVHVVHNEEASGNPMLRVPESSKFPPNLKTLVLTSTYLKWQQMSVLGSLGLLKILKLKENSFTGSSWEVSIGGFQELELLDIDRADVVFWTAPEGSLPRLRFLSLRTCERLEKVPFALGKKLEVLSLESVTKTCVSSAREIKKAKGGDLVLKIAPQDDKREP